MNIDISILCNDTEVSSKKNINSTVLNGGCAILPAIKKGKDNFNYVKVDKVRIKFPDGSIAKDISIKTGSKNSVKNIEKESDIYVRFPDPDTAIVGKRDEELVKEIRDWLDKIDELDVSDEE